MEFQNVTVELPHVFGSAEFINGCVEFEDGPRLLRDAAKDALSSGTVPSDSPELAAYLKEASDALWRANEIIDGYSQKARMHYDYTSVYGEKEILIGSEEFITLQLGMLTELSDYGAEFSRLMEFAD